MKVLALSSFRGRYGMIRSGMRFNCEPGYATALEAKKLIRVLPDEPGPSLNAAVPQAPFVAGKAPAGSTGMPDESSPVSADPPAAGKVLTSSSSRVVRASRKKTRKPSALGAPP